MARPALPDRGFAQMARGAAGAALGAILAGLPVLWGQIGPPVILSGGLAIFCTFLTGMAWLQYGRPARILLLGVPLAWMWPAVAAWVVWGA